MYSGYVTERNSHPKDTASFLSLLTFSYIYSYIKRGNLKDLNEDDICKTWTKFVSREMGDKTEKLWNQQKVLLGKRKSIVKLLCDRFLKKYLCLGVIQLVVKLLYITSIPYSVSKLVNYFKDGQTDITKEEAWMYAGMVIFTNTAFLFYEQHYMLLKSELGMEIVTSLSSLIYRKTMKLSASKISEISTGKIVTAITKDIVQMEQAVYVVNDLWVELIQAAVVFYLLYIKLGISGFSGLSIIIIIVILQLYISTSVFKKRQEANNLSDVRVQLTQEAITSIKILKMYAWEIFFAKKIIRARKNEIQRLRTLAILRWFSSFLGNLSTKLSLFFVIMCYLWFGHTLTAEVVYFVATCFQKLRRTLAYIIPACIGTLAEFISCLRRLELILTAEEMRENRHKNSDSGVTARVDFIAADIAIGELIILKNVNLKLNSGVNILTGSVGSGKSSLLKAILGEYTTISGENNTEGSISYCPQDPWVFPATIKQNILFGQPYNEAKYNKILEVCALSFDLDMLTEGDETILNDCGVNLSKGQQTRVNMARALYKESDIYIFDDSLSSLDSHVSHYIFHHAFQNYLKNKLVLLSTHDKIFVNDADTVVMMLHRTVTFYGKRKNSQSSENPNDIINRTSKSSCQEGETILEEEPCNEKTKMIPKRTECTKRHIYREMIHSGRIGFRDYKNYFAFGGRLSGFFVIIGFFISIEICSGFSEKLLSKWVAVEEAIAVSSSKATMSNNTAFENFPSSFHHYKKKDGAIQLDTDTYERSITIDNYTYSDNATGILREDFVQRTIYINIYAFLVVSYCILIFISTSLLYVFSLKISKNLHKSMIFKVLAGKMSFFDINMSGNILNRFSKDLYNTDEWLPFVMNEALRMMTMLTATILLISSINLAFAVITLILLLFFYIACNYCIRPARTLQRISMATRSPVIGHLNATLEGLVTIRAFGAQSIFVDDFDKRQDLMVASNHLFEILMRGLAFTMHMLSAVYVLAIILGFLITEADSSSNVGLAITQSFVLSSFLDWGLRQWVLLESMMTHFQRAFQYTKVEIEEQTGQIIPNWPTGGCLEYRNVSLKYRGDKETVLRNLNFAIKQKEKIGIVGRTGSGKSSIISTLFRLYDIDGDIFIDNINIKAVSLDFLRNSICIIPQDPILFSGSVRVNIDPLNKYSDRELWKALHDVNLESCIENLDEDIHRTALTFSVGQKQLFCIVRAIVRQTKMIIMDEATAFLEEEADLMINNKISKLFENCTIITITHRLHSVKNYDRVLVMQKGEVIEFDRPNLLLENKDSVLYRMVHQMQQR